MDISASSRLLSASAIPSSTASTKASRQLLISCMIGNALEWYDFVIYGYFAVIFGSLFFPTYDPLTQILASWGVFWSGFLARPLGSIVFGHIGDKISRKFALMLSIYVMAIPTALMGCLPTYEQVGIIATVSIIILRVFQGFAIGGEFTGSMVFLVEHAPKDKKGLWGSWASFSAVLGVILGSVFVAHLNSKLSAEEMQSWGWRVPFIVSILGSLVGGYIRNKLNDPEVYLDAKARRKNEAVPLKSLLANYKSKVNLIIFLDFLTAIGFFTVAIFLATYFKTYLKLPADTSFFINTLSMCVFALFTLIGGWLSDRIGRKKALAYPCIGFIVLSYPLFMMMQTADPVSVALAQGMLALLMGIFFGTIPTALVEIMPTHVRFTGLSISHNICMAILGGSAPYLATYCIQSSHSLAAPAYLLILASSVSLLATFKLSKTH